VPCMIALPGCWTLAKRVCMYHHNMHANSLPMQACDMTSGWKVAHLQLKESVVI
jgi:hypothetical protein